jgi:hypothetical protein
MRFEFQYSGLTRRLLAPFLMGPRHSWIEVREQEIYVRMGFAFRATIPRNRIVEAQPAPCPMSVGVHGWRGRWLVNGSRVAGVALDVQPPTRGWFNGLPLKLRRLSLGIADPGAFLEALER